MPTVGIDGNTHAPVRRIAAVSIAATRLHQRLNLRSIEVRAHHAHAFAIGPIELAVPFVEMDLLRRESGAFGDDGLAVTTIEISTFDLPIVAAWYAHVRPVEMSRLQIHGDAIRQTASGNQGSGIGTVGIHREDPPTAQVENEQTACSRSSGFALRIAAWRLTHDNSSGLRWMLLTKPRDHTKADRLTNRSRHRG